MQKISSVVERLAVAVLLVGGAGMLTAMFLGTGDVVGTQFFGVPIHGVLEITESTMVLIVFGGLAYAQLRRKHIRVEIIYSHMGPRVRAGMDIVTDLAALIFFGFLLSEAVVEGLTSWRIRETADGLIQFPLYPARWILIAGTVLLLLQFVLDLIRDTQRLASGEEYEPPEDDDTMPDFAGFGTDE